MYPGFEEEVKSAIDAVKMTAERMKAGMGVMADTKTKEFAEIYNRFGSEKDKESYEKTLSGYFKNHPMQRDRSLDTGNRLANQQIQAQQKRSFSR